MSKVIDDWFIWVEANRDTPARAWEEEVLPQAKAALLADIMEIVGCKREWDTSEPYDNPDVAQGHNEAVSDITDKLKEYFGEDNA